MSDRIVVQCNTAGRGLVDVVQDIKRRLEPIERSLPTGYFIEYGGQFESQQSASRVIAVLFAVSLVGIFLVTYTHNEHSLPPLDSKLRDLSPDFPWLKVDCQLLFPPPTSRDVRPVPYSIVYSGPSS